MSELSDLPVRDIGVNLLSAGIWVAIGFFSSKIYFLVWRGVRRRKRKYFARFLGYAGNPKVVLRIGQNVHTSASGRSYDSISTPIAFGVNQLVYELSSLYAGLVQLDLCYHNRPIEEVLLEDLILIGGPGTNEVVKKLVIEGRIQFHKGGGVDFMHDRFFVNSKGERHYFERENDSFVDYGIFMKIPNPYSRGKSILVMYGLETFGTSAAIECMIHFDEITKVSASMFRRHRFSSAEELQFLFRVRGVGQLRNTTIEILDVFCSIPFKRGINREFLVDV